MYVIYIISTYLFHYKIDIFKKNANYILLYKYLHLTVEKNIVICISFHFIVKINCILNAFSK